MKILFSLAILVILAVAALFVWRALRRRGASRRLAIHSPPGVDEAGFVSINGAEQWVSIRGDDRANPVLVLLHGGPGTSFLPIAYEAVRPWERDFTLVQWDQPGAGRTFGRHGRANSGELSLERIARDGIAVVEHALARVGQDRAILVGISWGSVLGVAMARRRPGLFHAYVGGGQVVDMQKNEAVGYDALLAKVRAQGDAKAEARLLAIGAPPYPGQKELLAERKVLMAHPPASERGLYRRLIPVLLSGPGYGLTDALAWLRGAQFSTRTMLADLMAYSDDVPAPEMPVPVVIIQGDEDIQTPTVLARAYFDRMVAPSKRFVLLPGGGHSAVMAMPDRFLAELKAHVLPLAR